MVILFNNTLFYSNKILTMLIVVLFFVQFMIYFMVIKEKDVVLYVHASNKFISNIFF